MRATPHHDRGQQLVDRRKLLAGAAWSIPVIALSSAAPAFAASPTVEADVSPPIETGNKKEYQFEITVTASSQPITSLEVRFTLLGNAQYASTQPAPPTNWTRTSQSTTSITFSRNNPSTVNGVTIKPIFTLERQDANLSDVRIDILLNGVVMYIEVLDLNPNGL